MEEFSTDFSVIPDHVHDELQKSAENSSVGEMWRFLPGVSDPGAGTSSSSTSGKCDRDPNYDKQERRRSYRKEWEAEYKWLAYDEEEGLMYCKTCRTTKTTE